MINKQGDELNKLKNSINESYQKKRLRANELIK
jgi:hypothetical protein